MKNRILLSCFIVLFSSLSHATVTVNGQTLEPGGYEVDSSGQLVKTNDADAQGNGVNITVITKPVENQIYSRLCASAFMKKYAPQCH